jgi:hypothetical protein
MIKPEEDSLHALVQDIMYWACVGINFTLSLALFIGLGSYFYHRWF